MLLILSLSGVAAAQFEIDWYTIDGGGAMDVTDGSPIGFTLSGTIGQPDAGVLSGGTFQVAGGFWASAAKPGASTCPMDIAPPGGDGVINVSDLLLVIAHWGPCPDCVADANGDDVVNVNDLLTILANWGACPE